MQIRLNKAQKKQILNADDLYKIMQQVLLRQQKLRRGQEYFWVVGLDSRYTLLFVELVALGAANRVIVKAPEVFRVAIYKNATQVILVHNHPGQGRSKIVPSKADVDATDHWLKAGYLVDVQVLDHLVITETRFISFALEGIMEKIINRRSFEILPVERAELDRVREQALKDRAAKDSKREIAKAMKAKGYSTKDIQELTGLTARELKGV